MASEKKVLRVVHHCGVLFAILVPAGDHCPKCKAITGNTIHGRCLECGYQKHYSLTLARRGHKLAVEARNV